MKGQMLNNAHKIYTHTHRIRCLESYVAWVIFLGVECNLRSLFFLLNQAALKRLVMLTIAFVTSKSTITLNIFFTRVWSANWHVQRGWRWMASLRWFSRALLAQYKSIILSTKDILKIVCIDSRLGGLNYDNLSLSWAA